MRSALLIKCLALTLPSDAVASQLSVSPGHGHAQEQQLAVSYTIWSASCSSCIRIVALSLLIGHCGKTVGSGAGLSQKLLVHSCVWHLNVCVPSGFCFFELNFLLACLHRIMLCVYCIDKHEICAFHSVSPVATCYLSQVCFSGSARSRKWTP